MQGWPSGLSVPPWHGFIRIPLCEHGGRYYCQPHLWMEKLRFHWVIDILLHRSLQEEVAQADFLTLLCPKLPTGHPHLPACFLAFTAG